METNDKMVRVTYSFCLPDLKEELDLFAKEIGDLCCEFQ